LATFIMNEERTRQYAGDGPLMTDDMPVVEFTGPKSLHVNTISPNIANFVRHREPVIPYLRLSEDTDQEALGMELTKKYLAGRLNLIGRAYFADSNFPKAAAYFRKALEIDPTDRNSIHYKRKLRFF